MNPLFLTFLKGAIPYLIAAIAGFSLAFGIQELRLTAVEQDFREYKLDVLAEIERQTDIANTKRKKASNDYIQAKADLKKAIDTGEVFKRCVAAGKCGVRNNPVYSCTDNRIPTTGEPDGVGTNPVSTSVGDAAINECATTTLMLNKLQTDIESQPGY